ncbi:MAG: preprotein translocase subunit YajC [Pseudomonadota bacterium]|nr:preprotein translocase subunit YajC [Pseudomonadota bacterium]
MFIEVAHAAGEAAAPQGGLMTLIIYLLGFGAIFYFLIFRPQRKRQNDMKNLLNSLQVGSEVVINGGLMGKVVKLDETYAVVEIAPSVEIKVQKVAISATLPKDTLKNI